MHHTIFGVAPFRHLFVFAVFCQVLIRVACTRDSLASCNIWFYFRLSFYQLQLVHKLKSYIFASICTSDGCFFFVFVLNSTLNQIKDPFHFRQLATTMTALMTTNRRERLNSLVNLLNTKLWMEFRATNTFKYATMRDRKK